MMNDEIVLRYKNEFPDMRSFGGEHVPFVPIYRPNRLIAINHFKIDISKNFYNLSQEAEAYFEPIMDDLKREFSSKYYNSIVYGLTAIDPTSRRIILHSASFFHEWLMHLQPDRQFYSTHDHTLRDVFDREMVNDVKTVNGPKFFPFTLGINGLIFTSDGYLLFQHRPPRTVIEQDMLSTSFGGTFNTFGVKGKKNIIAEKISEILAREYNVFIDPELLADSAYLIGIDSNLYYMGKPDLYVFLIINATYDDFEVNKREVMYKQGVKLAPSFEDFIREPLVAVSKIRQIKEDFFYNKKSIYLLATLSMLEDVFKRIII